jgi:hypothetical protein
MANNVYRIERGGVVRSFNLSNRILEQHGSVLVSYIVALSG